MSREVAVASSLSDHISLSVGVAGDAMTIVEPARSVADYAEAWDRACRCLRAELGEDVYSSWFGRLNLDDVRDGVACMSVPTRFLKSWISSHYMNKIVAALSAGIPELTSAVIVVRSSGRAPAPGAGSFSPMADRGAASSLAIQMLHGGRAPDAARTGNTGGSGGRSPALSSSGGTSLPSTPGTVSDTHSAALDRRMTFETFCAGAPNQLAYVSAQRIANADPSAPSLYNPLYIHASVGLGKTHLAQACANAAMSAGRKVIYLTAEKFMYGFVTALRTQTAMAFKDHLRGIDMLVIDDIQFLQGKSLQHEFCHTINALIDNGKQVVVAADRPPADLEALEDRVRSRLAGGLCVEMGPPDEALRVRILESRIGAIKAQHPGFQISDVVVSFVAKCVDSNGRDLDGAVNRLLAHSLLSSAPLTVDIAESAIRDLVRTKDPKKVKIEDIQKLVASHYSITRADILSSRRTTAVVRPRQIAMYLSKLLTPRSLPEIGRRFGGRDHTTVLHAIRKIESLAEKNDTICDEIQLLRRMLVE